MRHYTWFDIRLRYNAVLFKERFGPSGFELAWDAEVLQDFFSGLEFSCGPSWNETAVSAVREQARVVLTNITHHPR